jgi:two-component system chemotaxis response regulator CheY
MKTALIIDDNKQAADMMFEMLEFLGLQPRVAYGPRDGMMAIKASVPDIVFLDINMPGVDGFEVMGYLRRAPELENTPVVFVTSDDQPETAQKARNTGALLLIVKPASLEILEATLRKVGLIQG